LLQIIPVEKKRKTLYTTIEIEATDGMEVQGYGEDEESRRSDKVRKG
jgi:hypothetical protein